LVSKLDLLGLRMHTAVRESLALLKRRRVFVDLDRLLLDDERTYRLLRTTDTVGVFQLESPGQRQLLGRLQPRDFADIIAEISLFRPGPVQGDMVNPYRKTERQGADYLYSSRPGTYTAGNIRSDPLPGANPEDRP
jgi:DNA polymerase III alpha subunit